VLASCRGNPARGVFKEKKMDYIRENDFVDVSFHGSQFTLCEMAKVIQLPFQNDIGCWIFENMEGKIYYVSEGCTVTKLSPDETEATRSCRG
jgi:hypothetical protein